MCWDPVGALPVNQTHPFLTGYNGKVQEYLNMKKSVISTIIIQRFTFRRVETCNIQEHFSQKYFQKSKVLKFNLALFNHDLC